MDTYLERRSKKLAEALAIPKVARAYRAVLKEVKPMAVEAANLYKAGLLDDITTDSFVAAISIACELAFDPVGIDIEYDGDFLVEAVMDEFMTSYDRAVFGRRKVAQPASA